MFILEIKYTKTTNIWNKILKFVYFFIYFYLRCQYDELNINQERFSTVLTRWWRTYILTSFYVTLVTFIVDVLIIISVLMDDTLDIDEPTTTVYRQELRPFTVTTYHSNPTTTTTSILHDLCHSTILWHAWLGPVLTLFCLSGWFSLVCS